jgi:hypothetical protein
MYRKEIFAKVLAEVEQITELSADVIVSKKRNEEIVDARCLLVYFLNEQGLYPCQIAQLMDLSLRHINDILSSFSERRESRKILRINYELMRKSLGSN